MSIEESNIDPDYQAVDAILGDGGDIIENEEYGESEEGETAPEDAGEEEEDEYGETDEEYGESEEEPEGEEPQEEEGEEEESEEEESEEEGEEEESEEEEEEPEAQLPSWAGKIKEKFPDRQFETLEDYDRAIADYTEELEQSVETFRETEQRLVDIFNQHPEMQPLLPYLEKGYSTRAALIAVGFTPEDFIIEDGDPDAEQLAEAKINQRKAKEERDQKLKALEENNRRSQEVINAFQERKGIKDSVKEKFLKEVEEVFNGFLDAKVEDRTLEIFWKAFNYDKALRTAEDKGRVMGRNEKIVLQKKKMMGDGVAKLSSAQAKKEKTTKTYSDPWDEILDKTLRDA